MNLNFDQIYQTTLTVVILPIIGWFVSRFSSFLTDKMDTNKKRKQKEELKEARLELSECVKNAILETEETFTVYLRQDGVFSEEDGIIAKAKTVERTRELLSAHSLSVFEESNIPIDNAIENQIEVQLPLLKARGLIKN